MKLFPKKKKKKSPTFKQKKSCHLLTSIYFIKEIKSYFHNIKQMLGFPLYTFFFFLVNTNNVSRTTLPKNPLIFVVAVFHFQFGNLAIKINLLKIYYFSKKTATVPLLSILKTFLGHISKIVTNVFNFNIFIFSSFFNENNYLSSNSKLQTLKRFL